MEDNKIDLTEQEVQMLNFYKIKIQDFQSKLGSLRQQYLIAEKNILAQLGISQEDFIKHMKMLLESKEQNPADWQYDEENQCFIKR